jgi:hypothetical protein
MKRGGALEMSQRAAREIERCFHGQAELSTF